MWLRAPDPWEDWTPVYAVHEDQVVNGMHGIIYMYCMGGPARGYFMSELQDGLHIDIAPFNEITVLDNYPAGTRLLRRNCPKPPCT